MNCPEQEQLMLYLDNELSVSEIAEIKAHVATCPKCQRELANFKSNLETETLLRKKVNLSLARRNLSQKIMGAVMAEPKHNKKLGHSSSSLLSKWVVKLLVPAMALTIVLFFLFKSNAPSPIKFDGKAYRVSVFTSSADSFVNGKPAEANHSFNIEANKFQKIDGTFLVNVVSSASQFSLLVEGKTDISFDKDNMIPVFRDCFAKINIVNGVSAKINVNGKIENLTSDRHIDLLPFGKGEDATQIPKAQKTESKLPAVPLEKVKSKEIVKIKEKADMDTEIATSDKPLMKAETPSQSLVNSISSDEREEAVAEVTSHAEENPEREVAENPTIHLEEGLTTSSTGAISIMDTASESRLDEWSNPFADPYSGGK